jgi:hypothetical protein
MRGWRLTTVGLAVLVFISVPNTISVLGQVDTANAKAIGGFSTGTVQAGKATRQEYWLHSSESSLLTLRSRLAAHMLSTNESLDASRTVFEDTSAIKIRYLLHGI